MKERTPYPFLKARAALGNGCRKLALTRSTKPGRMMADPDACDTAKTIETRDRSVSHASCVSGSNRAVPPIRGGFTHGR